MENLEKRVGYAKYTACSYVDALMSIPIWASEKIASYCEKRFKEKTPEFLQWEKITKKSPTHNKREQLRESYDSRPGALYLQSNVASTLVFFSVGASVAEFAQKGIDSYLSDAPVLAQCLANSLTTIAAQILVSQTAFMVNEVRTNREKYFNDDGKLIPGNVAKGYLKALTAFMTFDACYIATKTLGQTYLLAQGEDPWAASAICDSLAIPAWWTFTIPLGLKNGVIETKYTQNK